MSNYSQDFIRSLTPRQHQQLTSLTPGRKTIYLNQLHTVYKATQAQNQSISPVLVRPAVTAAPTPRRKKGGGPRKCNNPTCEKIVTKRNFCFKCQKRKERGLPMGPRLPSVNHLLSVERNPQEESPTLINLAPMLSVPAVPVAPSVSKNSPFMSAQSNSNINIEFIPQFPQQDQNDAKLEQLRSYLISLAGSEEKAEGLVQRYLTEKKGRVGGPPNVPHAQAIQPPQSSFARFY